MTTYGRSVCPNRPNLGEHQWYAWLMIFGLPVVRKCNICSAKRMF